jgi:hypothetical protein
MSATGAFAATIDQGEEDNRTPIDADLLLHFVEICLAKLDGAERDKFVGALHSALSSGVDQMLTPPAKPRPNGNGKPSGSNTTFDRGMRSGNRSGARDRRTPAQDAAIRSSVAAVNTRSFLQRFPEAKHIRLSGSWRD